MGKGLAGNTLVQRKHLPDMQGWINDANLTATITKENIHIKCIADYGNIFLHTVLDSNAQTSLWLNPLTSHFRSDRGSVKVSSNLRFKVPHLFSVCS